MISVVFDMDGILFDTQKVYCRTWAEVAEILNLKDLDEPAFYCIGRNRKDQEEILNRYYPEGFPFDEFYRLKNEIFDEHIEQDGIPLKEGTLEILEYLKSINAKVAIASSSRIDVIEHHLEETGLRNMFDKIIGGNMVEHSKPSPDIYLKACSELGVNPEETFAVEDSYNGVRAAVAAGMKTIMIPDVQPPTDELDKVIFARFASLVELKKYFEGLC